MGRLRLPSSIPNKASLKKVEFFINFTPNSTQIQKGTFTKISYSIYCDMRNHAAIRSIYCICRTYSPCFTVRSDVFAVALRLAHDLPSLSRHPPRLFSQIPLRIRSIFPCVARYFSTPSIVHRHRQVPWAPFKCQLPC